MEILIATGGIKIRQRVGSNLFILHLFYVEFCKCSSTEKPVFGTFKWNLWLSLIIQHTVFQIQCEFWEFSNLGAPCSTCLSLSRLHCKHHYSSLCIKHAFHLTHSRKQHIILFNLTKIWILDQCCVAGAAKTVLSKRLCPIWRTY